MDDHEQDSSLPKELVATEQAMHFYGDTLIIIVTTTNLIYFSLPSLCDALGLTLKGQVQRIKRNKVLAKGLRHIYLNTKGGYQWTNCLHLDTVVLWLAGVQLRRMKDDMIRHKIELYQEKLTLALINDFIRPLIIPPLPSVLSATSLHIDVRGRRVICRDKEINLTPREFDLLVQLVHNQGKTLTHEQLLSKVWGNEYMGDVRTIKVHVRWLRGKLEEDPNNPKLIQTVHGVGYRFS